VNRAIARFILRFGGAESKGCAPARHDASVVAASLWQFSAISAPLRFTPLLSPTCLRLFSVHSVSNLLTSATSETPTNHLSSTFVLDRIGPSGLSTPPLPTGTLSRVRGSAKRLECLHLHHPNAHERPAPPPAAPPFFSKNFDRKSFTTITLMPSINASFLTSSSRGSIDSRIGAV